MSSRADDGWIEVGTIGRPHGVRGEVNVRLHQAASPALLALRDARLKLGGSTRPCSLDAFRAVGDRAVVRFSGVADRDAAAALTHAALLAPVSLFPPLEEDDAYYAFELEGMTAVDEETQPVGRVRTLTSFGAGDILVVALERTGEELLLPFAEPYVGKVDRAARTVVVRPLDLA
jgi:16S rRNA processing protein RimM